MASRSLGTLTLDLIARIGGFEQSMDRASRSVSRTASVASASSREVITLQNSFRSLASVAAGIAGPLAAALSVKGVYDMTEAYSTLTNRLKLVTNGSAELVAAQAAVFNIAQAAAQPLASTAELYQRIATNQEALKLSGEGVAGVVGTISKTLAVSGASAASANAALIQLGQAFASGVLRGEELNSVMEQAPALAQAIAAGMGKTVGELRSMGAAGELTAQAVVKALQGQAGAVDELFAKTATTVGNSFTKIGNSLTHFVGEIDQATGASNALAEKFVSVSKAIDDSLPASLAAIKNNTEALSQTLTTVLFVALGRIAGGYAASAGAAIANAAAVGRLAIANQEAAVAAVRKAEVDLVSAKNALQLARMNIALAVSVKDVAIAEKALDVAKTKALAMSAQLSQARGLEAIANTAVTASTTASGVAMGLATRAANSLRVAGAGLLALVGGPVGLAFIAGAVALSFVDWGSKSKKLMGDLSDLDGTVEALRQSFIKLNEDQQRSKISEWQDKQLGATLAVKEAYEDLKISIKESMVSPADVMSPGYTKQLQEFEAISGQLDEARSKGESLSPILDNLASKTGVKPEASQSWVVMAGVVSDAQQVLDKTTERLDLLSTSLTRNTTETQLNNQAKSGVTAGGQKYLATLQEQLKKLQDNGDAVKEVTRHIAEHTELSESERIAILSTGHAIKAQTDANKAATKATKDSTSAVKAHQKAFDSTEEDYQRQIELINTTTDKQKNATEVSKLAFEITSGKLVGINALQQKRLEGLAVELDSLKQLKQANEDAAKLAAFGTTLKDTNQTISQGYRIELSGAGSGDKLKERLQADLEIQQEHDKQVSDLFKQRNAGDISRELYKQETELLSEALAERMVIQQDYYNQLDAAQSNWMDGVGDAWNNYLDQSRDISGQTKDMFTDAFSGMNDALYTFVTTGKLSFSDMAATFASSALKMLIQWGTAQVAMAALNAFTSTAAIPIVGPLAAPAAAASALGAAGSFMGMIGSVAGMAHDGIDAVPETGTWLLQKGERVTTAQTSAKLDRTLEQVSQGGGSNGKGLTVNLIENPNRAGQVERGKNPDGSDYLNLLVSKIREGGNEASDAFESTYSLRRNAG